MGEVEHWARRILPVDEAVRAAAGRLLDGKTKPRRSLGRLEDLASQVAAVRRSTSLPSLSKAIVVMGADHGVAAEGVSAYPQEVTAQMLANFARGGAAINVLARHANARLVVVDMGVRHPVPVVAAPTPGLDLRANPMGPGTGNFTLGPAMTREQAEAAIGYGATLAAELAADGIGLVGVGEMGIGNTTASAALTACFCAVAPEEVVGRGTGVDDDGLKRKIDAVRRGLARHQPNSADPLGALAAVGGFEIAGLAGLVLGAAAAGLVVLVDGFISSVAALAAVRVAPAAAGYLVASHRSVEVGHRMVLQALATKPLLDLDLRLGEGTGAALAMPLVDAALRILAEMATFDAAGVSDSGA